MKTEHDIKIEILSDSEIQNFSPPTKITEHNNSNYKNKTVYNKNFRNSNYYETKTEYLGQGGFSKVYKYKGDLEKKAVKKIFADPKYYSKKLTIEDSIKREVYGLKKCECEHSLKIYGVYQNKQGNTFYILMEQCQGNIEQLIKKLGRPLNINELYEILTQLNDAFRKLNNNNIIHRDIKPINILYIEEGKTKNKNIFDGKKINFKLGDYGICLPLYHKIYSKSQFMGTLDYMAPEIYSMRTEKEHPIYTKKMDLFSLGQTILCLMGYLSEKNGTLMENKVEELKMKNNLFYGNIKEQQLADLIFNYLLVFDPNERAGWIRYFNHPFFYKKNRVVKNKVIKKIKTKKINLKSNRSISPAKDGNLTDRKNKKSLEMITVNNFQINSHRNMNKKKNSIEYKNINNLNVISNNYNKDSFKQIYSNTYDNNNNYFFCGNNYLNEWNNKYNNDNFYNNKYKYIYFNDKLNNIDNHTPAKNYNTRTLNVFIRKNNNEGLYNELENNKRTLLRLSSVNNVEKNQIKNDKIGVFNHRYSNDFYYNMNSPNRNYNRNTFFHYSRSPEERKDNCSFHYSNCCSNIINRKKNYKITFKKRLYI